MGSGNSIGSPATVKKTECLENKNILVASSCMQGWRDYMEDTHSKLLSLPGDGNASYFAVYDGHSGVKIATYSQLYLHTKITDQSSYWDGDITDAIQKGFLQLDEEMMKRYYGHDMAGCTAVSVLIKDNVLYCGNVGDSRAIASVNGICVPLSNDHKPQHKEESDRIYAAGGTVNYNRVNGRLALSRALGDYEFKNNSKLRPEKQVVTAFPEVIVKDNLKDFEFIILASDGLWDVLSSEEVISFVQTCIATNKPPADICEMLISACLAPDNQMMGLGYDNVTVILVCFLHGKTFSSLVQKCKDIVSQNR